jgi:hypothetical protein
MRMPSQLIPHDAPPGARPPEPARPFAWQQAPWGWVLTCPPLAALGRHGFTIRDLNPGRGARADRRLGAVAAWLDVPPASL